MDLQQSISKMSLFRSFFYKARNVSSSAFRSYIIDRYSTNKIQNDMGASFTKIIRKHDKLLKQAEHGGEEKLRDEIEWILKFRKGKFGKYLPVIYDYSLNHGNVFYLMKYYPYPNLRKIIIEDLNTRYIIEKRWEKIIKVLFTKFYIHSYSKPPDENFFLKSHIKKYKSRIEQTRKSAPEFTGIIDSSSLFINSVKKIGPEVLLNAIVNNPEIINRLTPPLLYVSHGDVHSNNIICGLTTGSFILLDSRGRSPEGDYFFDPAYDIAKIYHDLHSFYPLIENLGFSIEHSTHDNNIHIEYAFTDNFLVEKFTRYYFFVRSHISSRYQRGEFSSLNYRADFTEAMLYLTMIPLHLRNKNEGLICLTTGIIRLNQWFKRYHFELYKQIMAQNNQKQKTEVSN